MVRSYSPTSDRNYCHTCMYVSMYNCRYVCVSACLCACIYAYTYTVSSLIIMLHLAKPKPNSI